MQDLCWGSERLGLKSWATGGQRHHDLQSGRGMVPAVQIQPLHIPRGEMFDTWHEMRRII